MRKIALLIVIAVLCVLSAEQQTKPSLIGKPAPDFALPTIDGKKLRLSELKGKVVLLNFFSHW